MIYDCRRDGRDPRAESFPCNVRVLDPATGERIPNVFFLDTSPAQVGRFVTDADGNPMAGGRRKVLRADGRGGKRLDFEYDRLEVWEYRPWVAVAVAGGGVVAKSGGVG